jgi:nicotinamide phosphoribosyltransferase
MRLRPLSAIDFYKADHRRQYPVGTEMVYSNLTARSDKLKCIPDPLWTGKITFFGLQYFIKNFLIDEWNKGFFYRDKKTVIDEYKRRMDTSLGAGAIPVDHIEALHDLGYLPICIKAIPEGSAVPIKVPCLVMYNTHPEFFWLTNYLETILSCYLWKATTSATIARHYRILLENHARQTGAPLEFVGFQAHDFSFRGMAGPEGAALSGAGHLVSFVGTDTVPAIDLIEDYYNGNAEKELIGCSVPATEHSVMCMGGKDDEVGTFRRIITELYPKGIVSIVSDTWDFWNVITKTAPTLKSEIMAREGKVVFRPDSGDPVHIICRRTRHTSRSAYV